MATKSRRELTEAENKFYQPILMWEGLISAVLSGATKGFISDLSPTRWHEEAIGLVAFLILSWFLDRCIRPTLWWRSDKVAQRLEAVFIFLVMTGLIAILIGLAAQSMGYLQ